MNKKMNLDSSEDNTSNEKANKTNIELLKKLREQTQLSFADCKEAAEKSGGDESKALLILRSKSLINAAKRIDRPTKAGVVVSHLPKIRKDRPGAGVLIELRCETNFVSNTPEFMALARKLALHVFDHDPIYVYFEDIPKKIWKSTFDSNLQTIKQTHPNCSPKEQENLAKERTEKELTATVLACQQVDGVDGVDMTVSEYIGSFIGLFRENIRIRRFTKFSVLD